MAGSTLRKCFAALATVAAFSGSCFVGADPAVAGSASVEVQNLAVSGYAQPLEGGDIAIMVDEFGQGADLNGDGDTGDWVLHLWSQATGLENTGVVSFGGNPRVGGGFAWIVAEDMSSATDLNGDGDAFDYVLHVWSRGSGIANLGVAVHGVAPLDDHGRMAVLVSEFQDGVDRNGDGLATAGVVHIWDPTTGFTNLGIGGEALSQVDGGAFTFRASEEFAGSAPADLNSDGDTADQVVQIWDPVAGLQNLGLAVTESRADPVGESVHIFASEAAHGNLDLNGDGDATDTMAYAWTPDLGLVSAGVAGGAIAGNGDPWLLSVSEAEQSASDLNGDGDAGDYVVHTWRPGAPLTNTSLSANVFGSTTLADGTVALLASEFDMNADLNDDGDATDGVPHLLRSSGEIVNLGIAASSPFTLATGDLAFSVSEVGDGFRDHDGDGQASDSVLFTWSEGSGAQYAGINVHGSELATPDGGFFYSRSEWMTRVDGNGDGDETDANVVAYWRPDVGVVNAGVAGYLNLLSDSGFHPVGVNEADQGNQDLNGDGDTFDTIIHLVRIVLPEAEAPVVSGVRTQPERGARVGESFELLAQTSDEATGGSAIAGATYTVDGGAPVPMVPSDGAFDEAVEPVVAQISFGTRGRRLLCVTATDVAGNVSEPICTTIRVRGRNEA